MLKSSARSVIRLRGVRHNNLKNFDLDLPLNQLIVITGLSGSGKSSLAFDTLFAEGQRRYIETFSPYARQFFDRMDKPQVDNIEGIPPAVAIEQRNAVKTTRSTVGTMTEICDYMKLLWPNIARLHCRQCGDPVRKESPQQAWEAIAGCGLRIADSPKGGQQAGPEVLITFDLPLSEKLSIEESLALVSKQGYQRLLLNGQVMRLEEALKQSAIRNPQSAIAPSTITVLQDRLKPTPANRARFIEACEQAYHFGKGKLAVWPLENPQSATPMNREQVRNPQFFSSRLHCARCDIEYREPTPALFSFNHPVGACPECKGFGRVISIDYDTALPDRSKTLAEGVVKPWLVGHGLESQRDLMRACRELEIPTNVPFEKLAKKWQKFVIEGDPDYGKDEEHEWPRAWYGVKGYFRWLESKAYKMHVRVLLSRYRAYTLCPKCQGARFQPEALLYRLPRAADVRRLHSESEKVEPPHVGCYESLNLSQFYQLPVRDALQFVEGLAAKHKPSPADPLGLVLTEVQSRLGYLCEVGLGYLTLDRPTRSLSGGETERVNLTTCLGTRLVNTLFVLDEPSVGLHPRDTERLVRILQRLRDAGNTVVVVEHEAGVMRAADQIVDLGPGHGSTGGQVVFQGTYPEILKAEQSLTGQYLSGRKRMEKPELRPVKLERAVRTSAVPYAASDEIQALALNDALPRRPDGPAAPAPALKIEHATRHNLRDVSIELPLERFVCVTGVSGSGKTTLVREVLLPALEARLRARAVGGGAVKAPGRGEDENEDENENEGKGRAAHIGGYESLSRVVLVDQAILGKTPRSNPAVYIGAFDDIREVFAQSETAKRRGLNASAFSFNSAQGQCERCRGAGFEKIEMQFLSDVYIRCPDCNGRRYRQHILEVKLRSNRPEQIKNQKSKIKNGEAPGEWSIGDLLDATVEEAIEFLSGFAELRPAKRAVQSLKLLEEVGLGYLKLGQPINTLSGGESQRLKLVRHLAEFGAADSTRQTSRQPAETGTSNRTLFLFDEPTTGLHFEDVRVLIKVFQRLVNAGHSVLVIEHNLDVIRSADWVIDMGPGAGDEGGEIVAQGTPDEVATNPRSHTGRFLKGDAGAGSAQSSFPAPQRTRNKPGLFRRAGKLKAPR